MPDNNAVVDVPVTDLPVDTPEPVVDAAPPVDEPVVDAAAEPAAEPPAEPAAPAEDPRDVAIQEMRTRMDEMAEQLKSRAEPQKPPEEPYKDPFSNPEFLAEQVKYLGFSKVKDPETGAESTSLNEQQFVKSIFKLIQEGMSQVKKYTDETVHGNVSDMRFETSIADLERKSPDIRKYAKEIKEYLKKRYQPKDFSNPEFIMDGLYWAKGKAGKPNAAPARPNGRVVPVAPAKPGARPAAAPPLTAEAKAMIADGTFKDEAEYRAWAKSDPSKL